MTDSNLTSAKYYDHVDDAEVAAAVQSIAKPSAAGMGAYFTSRISMFVGSALAVCLLLLAVGYFAAAHRRVSARADESTHPIDWLLWFGGAEDDQTFEKFVNDSIEQSQREFEEQLRNSPAYGDGEIDFEQLKLQLDPAVFPQNQPRRPSR